MLAACYLSISIVIHILCACFVVVSPFAPFHANNKLTRARARPLYSIRDKMYKKAETRARAREEMVEFKERCSPRGEDEKIIIIITVIIISADDIRSAQWKIKSWNLFDVAFSMLNISISFALTHLALTGPCERAAAHPQLHSFAAVKHEFRSEASTPTRYRWMNNFEFSMENE